MRVTVQSKFEHNDYTGFEYHPTGRLLWTPPKRQTFWAAVSRAVRTPTLSEDAIGTRQLPISTAPPTELGCARVGSLDSSQDVIRLLAMAVMKTKAKSSAAKARPDRELSGRQLALILQKIDSDR